MIDEFLGLERTTQNSSIMMEQYYTFAETAADLHLAGKLKIRKTYEVLPDPVLLASAEATVELDPEMVGLHSLSTATRSQTLPRAGKLLSCEDAQWIAVPNGDGTNYLRKVSDNLTASAGEVHEQDAGDETCRNPIKTVSYDGYDAFNLAASETVLVREQPGPFGLTVPGFTRTTQNDYEEAREVLEPLGIVTAASERRILTGTRLLSRERFTYLAESGGRLGSRTLDVFSGLGTVPEPLADLHRPTHTLTKAMLYDSFGNIVTMSDDLGDIERVSFDETGTLPVSHTRVAGRDAAFDQVTRMDYSGPRAGAVARQTTPLGVQVDYDYDALGRKTSERADDGAEKLFFYKIGRDDLPSLIMTSRRRYADAAEVPPLESEWIDQIAAHNARGNRIAEIADVAEGGVRVFNFSLFNRNERETFRWTPFTTQDHGGVSPASVRSVFESGTIPRPEHEIGNAYAYDAIGQMVRETHPSGKVSTMEYAPWGNRRETRYEDQFDGTVTTEEYRVLNDNGISAVVVSDGAGTQHVSRFTRDSFGYLTEILLPGEDAPRRFVHNSIGDIEHQVVPGMGELFYFYDARGRQSAKARVAEDGETRLLTFTYDFLNRKLSESEDGELRVEFRYDEGVEIASAAAFETPITLPLNETTQVISHDPNGLFDAVQRFGYNRNGRMVQAEMEINGNRYAESFHHTLDGRIDSSTGPRGLFAKFALGPDQNLRAVTIDHDDFAAPEQVIENIFYNAEGRMRRIDYRAGAFTEMTYNPETLFLTRIVSEAAGLPIQDLSMTFNGNGSITEIVDGLAATDPGFGHVDRSGTFRYDFKNQLVGINRYGVEAMFEYSEAGTFSRNDEFAAGEELTLPDDAPTRLIPASTAAQPYAFDGFGEMASSPRLNATVFDAHGRLLRSQTETLDVFYGYDQTGRRIYKHIVPLSTPDQVETYFYPLETFEVGPKGEESYVNIGTSRLVRMEHGTGRWFYYLRDHLESSDYVIASDGVPVEQMLYKAYGTEHQPETLNPNWATHVSAIPDQLPRERTHHRFTGKYLDDDTGLYYFGARYYDPALGRFISPDPLYLADPNRCTVNPLACNLFAYANNNPMAFIDPTGLDGVVAGDEAYRRQVEEQLQRLDPTARVDRETGEISQSWLHGLWLDIVDFFRPGSGHDTGRELVSRIIESEQTTTIQAGRPEDRDDPAAYPTDATRDITTTPGDVMIDFNPAMSFTLPEFDPSTGTSSEVAADPAIVLGHEMIHATRMMAGRDAGEAPVIYNGLDGSPQVAIREEARTVGVGGVNETGDITENDLREMLGINPRNHY